MHPWRNAHENIYEYRDHFDTSRCTGIVAAAAAAAAVGGGGGGGKFSQGAVVTEREGGREGGRKGGR